MNSKKLLSNPVVATEASNSSCKASIADRRVVALVVASVNGARSIVTGDYLVDCKSGICEFLLVLVDEDIVGCGEVVHMTEKSFQALSVFDVDFFSGLFGGKSKEYPTNAKLGKRISGADSCISQSDITFPAIWTKRSELLTHFQSHRYKGGIRVRRPGATNPRRGAHRQAPTESC